MHDVVIRGGLVVDGTGRAPRRADVAVKDGLIVDIGSDLGRAAQTIEADSALVTPGWVDIHTHYDGQATWDAELAPSAQNGVTTAVMGNCGVGFAPARPGREQSLIELMEGVEDIPGAALATGIPWGEWETFPEYLDHLESRTYSLDVGAQIAHGPLRYYVMGERGAANENASLDDVTEQAAIVGEALAAGALGFTTSRTIGHRALNGEPVPGTFASRRELLAIAAAVRPTGAVIEAIPASTVGPLEHLGGEHSTLLEEIELLRELSIEAQGPVTFTLVASSLDPDGWRRALTAVEAANGAGARLYPQVPSRPVSVVSGLAGCHAFMRKPLYLDQLAALPLAERAEAMRRPEVRHLLMTQESVPPDAEGSMESLYRLLTMAARSMVPIDDSADYLDTDVSSFGAAADARGDDPLEVLYEFLIADGGSRFARLAPDSPEATRQAVHELMIHETSVFGLSDAGAHVTMICDATMPTTQLTHWGRDCPADTRLPIEFLVHKQSRRNADLYGLSDRGSLEPGLRGDINVIDLDRLRVRPPVPRHDLPAGGMRLIQPVEGYLATLCRGVVTRRFDEDTGARPGRLARRPS